MKPQLKAPQSVTIPIIKIPDARERDLLFASLYMAHGMWAESFIVSEDGEVLPNPKWWRKRQIFTSERLTAVLCFCKGWMDGRRAEAIEKECEAFAKGQLPKVK